MKALWVFTIAAAIVFAMHHHHLPAAKIQDRMVTDGDRRFCAVYYAWRETQAVGGIPAVDRLCFDAQEMMP